MRTSLMDWAGSKGYAIACCSGAAAAEALQEIRRLRDQGAFDNAFYQRALSRLERLGDSVPSSGQSVILVAAPRPAHTVTFDYRGRSHDLVLPPTYYRFVSVLVEISNDLKDLFGDTVSLHTAKLPLKALAASTGFARYGRNNITYVRDLGSYVQLMAFAISVPLEPSFAPGTAVMATLDECYRCRACQSACPTGAIRADRFLLHAERCVTWFSEFEGPLPEAFGAAVRPCLVGCMVCQEVCPRNKGLLRFESLGVHFTEDETAFLLGESDVGGPTPELRAKGEAMGSEDYDLSSGKPSALFRRNLRAVLKHRASAESEGECR